MRRRTRRTLLAVLIVGTTLGVLVYKIPDFVDKNELRASIEKGLHESTGVHFKIKELTLESTLFQGLQVHLNTTAITDLNHHPLGSVRNITVQIRYLPLLLQQLPEISKIHINHVRIPVGEYSLFKSLKLKLVKPKRTGFIKPAEMRDTEILVSDYQIDDVQVADSLAILLPKAQRFRLDGRQLSIKHLESNRPISVRGEGTMTFATRKPDAKLTLGHFDTWIEVPQSVSEEGHRFTTADIARLNLTLKGPDLALKLRYQHKPNQDGIGQINTPSISLNRTQILLFQLADTFGFPLPNALHQVYLSGHASLNDGFRLIFKDPTHPIAKIQGLVRLHDVAASRPQAWPERMISHMNGEFQFQNEQLKIKRLHFLASTLPLTLSGSFNVNSQAMDLRLQGQDITVASAQRALRDFGVPLTALAGRDLTGVLNLDAKLGQILSNPSYQGTLSLREGRWSDESLGLLLSPFKAVFRFDGSGFSTPTVRYEGELIAQNSKLQQDNLNINRLNGHITFQGSLKGLGPVPIPDYRGLITVADGSYRDPETGLQVQQVQGQVRIDDQIHLEQGRGLLGSALFTANGTLSKDFKAYNIQVASQHINLPPFKDEVLVKIPQASELLAQLQPESGQANLDLTISTGPQVNGRIDINRLALRTGEEGNPIRIPTLSLRIHDNQVTIADTTAHYDSLALRFGGSFSPGGTYRFTFASDRVPMETLRENQDLLLVLSGLELPRIWNTAGDFSLDGRLSNQGHRINLIFRGAGLSWEGGDFPLYNLNGHLFYQQKNGGKPVIATRNLTFHYGNSPIAVEAHNQNNLRLRANGILSALTVNHFLVSPQSSATPYREIPFLATADGILGGLPVTPNSTQNNVLATLSLDLNPNFKEGRWEDPTQRPSTPADQASEGNIPTGIPNLEDPALQGGDNAYLNARLRWQGDTIQLEQALLHLFEAGNLLADGVLEHPFTPDAQLLRLHLHTAPELSLGKLSHETHAKDFFRGADGTVRTDLTLLGNAWGPQSLDGWLTLDRVAIPYLTVQEATGRVDFTQRNATATVDVFRLPGVDSRMSATTDDVFDVPVTLENVKISGPLLSIDSLVGFNEEVVAPILVDQVAHNFIRPWQQGDPVLPIQFRDADTHFDEVILQNIIMENATGRFSVYANGFFELSQASLEAAGGTATGYFSMNPTEDNFMTLELNAQEVSANALTRALLNTTNQIFGDLNGTVRFTTFGKTDQEMIRNANGTVRMSVGNGRLPAIAKVETLLATANVLRGGLLGLNLNNLFRSLAFYESNYFAELSGDLLVANGILYTENLISDGDNLDLVIQGSLSMENGAANMLVNGQMQQNVTGRFGRLGQWSLARLIRFIPALGTLGRNQPGLLDYLPGLGYVPGFGGPAGEQSHFQVRLMGMLDDPAAIRDFRWVSASPLP